MTPVELLQNAFDGRAFADKEAERLGFTQQDLVVARADKLVYCFR